MSTATKIKINPGKPIFENISPSPLLVVPCPTFYNFILSKSLKTSTNPLSFVKIQKYNQLYKFHFSIALVYDMVRK